MTASASLLIAATALSIGHSQHVGEALQATVTFGIDADASGNTATSLGPIDDCVSVPSGSTFDVDIFVTDVTDIAGWQAALTYDPAVVTVADAKVDLFLAADPESDVTNLSDYPPDSDGDFLFAVGDLRERGGEDGSGVLARVSLEAVGVGVSSLDLQEIVIAGPGGTIIGDVGGDDSYDGPVHLARVAVDQSCASAPPPTTTETPEATAIPPGTETPATPAPPSPTPAATAPPTQPAASSPTPVATGEAGKDDDGGFPWAIVAAATAGAAVVAGVSLVGWRLLLQHRA